MSALLARNRLALVAVLGAMALIVLDAGMVGVAVPNIAQSLGVRPDKAIRAMTAYQAAIVLSLLPCANLAARYGDSRLLLCGLLLFCFGSLACAFAGEVAVLLVARAIQGAGGAAIMAVGVAILRAEWGEHRLNDAIAWNTLTVSLCSAVAPITGAFVLANSSWPWLFLLELPMAVIVGAAALLLSQRAEVCHPADLVGILLHILIFLLVLVTLALLERHPDLAFVAALATAGVILGLHRRLGKIRNPIWPTDLLASPPLRIAMLTSIGCFIAQSAGILALSFQLQSVLGAGPVASGLVMACWPIAVAITSLFITRPLKSASSAMLCAIGCATLGSGLLMAAISSEVSVWPLAASASLSGLGFGLFQVPNNRTMFLAAPPDRGAAAGGVQGTSRLLGQAIGAWFIGALFASSTDALAPRLGLAFASASAFVAALVSGTIVISRPLRATATRSAASKSREKPLDEDQPVGSKPSEEQVNHRSD